MFLEIDHAVSFHYHGRDTFAPRQYHVPILFVTKDVDILDQHGSWLILRSCKESEAAVSLVESATKGHFRASIQKMIQNGEYMAVLPFYLEQHDLAGKTATMTMEIKAVRVKRHGIQTFAHLVLQVVAIKHVRSKSTEKN